MGAYLVCTAGFELAAKKAYVLICTEGFVMCDGVFALGGISADADAATIGGATFEG